MSSCVANPTKAYSPKSFKSNFNSNKEMKSKSSCQKKVGMFNIGEKLGEGTFSKVCLGTHTLTNQKVNIR
jgi:serine/threonine protein kinase